MPHRTMQSDPDYLSVSDAADLAGISASTLLRYEKKQFIQADRTLGNHRRFKRSDVEALKQQVAS